MMCTRAVARMSLGVPKELQGHWYGWNLVGDGGRPEMKPEAAGPRLLLG